MMSTEDTQYLFAAAIFLYNVALDKHREVSPCKQILAECSHGLSSFAIDLQIWDNDPEAAIERFTVRFEQGRLVLVNSGSQEADVSWKVDRKYLEEVIADPEQYLQHPEKLDWSWINSPLYAFAASSPTPSR